MSFCGRAAAQPVTLRAAVSHQRTLRKFQRKRKIRQLLFADRAETLYTRVQPGLGPHRTLGHSVSVCFIAPKLYDHLNFLAVVGGDAAAAAGSNSDEYRLSYASEGASKLSAAMFLPLSLSFWAEGTSFPPVVPMWRFCCCACFPFFALLRLADAAVRPARYASRHIINSVIIL